MERFTDEAVVLGSVPYGDDDKVVTLFTRQHGRLAAFAAHARKSRRRFAGALEPGTHLTARLQERRGDTYRLEEVDVRGSFHHLRQELPLIARSLYAVELVRELTRDRQAHQALFDELLAYLTALDAGRAGPTSLLAFELQVLAEAGYRPSFSPCLRCGGAPGPRPRFDPSEGGGLCEACAPKGWPVSLEVLLALEALQAGARVPLPAAVRAQARRLLNVFIEHHVGRKLNGVAFMDALQED